MLRYLFALFLSSLPAPLSFSVPPVTPPNLSVPANTATILDHIYSAQNDQAIYEARQMQQQHPNLPLGYILEDEALWWKIWCASAEFKYGITMPRHREKVPSDKHYLEVAAKGYSLAEASLARHESAEMYLYAGMADALTARMYSLRGENRSTARVGVRARANFQRALALDPTIVDADLGLGLYNYYVDTLSSIARVLRFFMGVPGGSREEGIRQLNRAMREGQLTPSEARFYLALNLHNYDQRYEEALRVLEPLAAQYPENPLFQLARGDLYAKLGRKQSAVAAYRAAAAAGSKMADPECRARVAVLVRESIAALGVSSSSNP
jgi:tetratricopeptide (TPR) repeat protein